MKIDGTDKNIAAETRSPVTVVPPDKETLKNKKIVSSKQQILGCRKSELNFLGKITLEAESEEIGKKLNIIVFKKRVEPLLLMNW